MSGNSLSMTGIRNFIIGFCLSMFSVALCERLISPTPHSIRLHNRQNIKISFFKEHLNNSVSSYPILFAEVKKQSLSIPQAFDTPQVSPEGDEDDEIISINFDDQIPIEQEVGSNSFEPSDMQQNTASDTSVALLPSEDEQNAFSGVSPISDTPWVTAKTKKTAKNKNFEHFMSNQQKNLFTENLQQLTQNDDAVSYKVAERIKQSIIFPIPDEILNDENLTPTFIREKSPSSPKSATKPQKSSSKSTSVTEIKKQDTTFKKSASAPNNPPATNTKSDTTGILDSISSWFNTPKQSPTADAAPEVQTVRKKKSAPTYETNTQVVSTPNNTKTKQEELVDFYSSLQETRNEYAQRKIVPSELKLSFQPGKAEISGTTLTWLKAFSEATASDDIRLQIRLDAAVATELQKKRLNMLYAIFMNNGVDFRKVDTVFSNTEPNALIIRTIRSK